MRVNAVSFPSKEERMSRVMREPPKIPIEALQACVQDHYTLFPVTLEFLPVGLDSHAGVYRVVSEQGKSLSPQSHIQTTL